MKLQVKKNGQAIITVPKSMKNAMDWKHGDRLQWKLNNKGRLELIEKQSE